MAALHLRLNNDTLLPRCGACTMCWFLVIGAGLY